MSNKLINLKNKINKDILNNKNFDNIKLINFYEIKDNFNDFCWYRMYFSMISNNKTFIKISVYNYDSEIWEHIEWFKCVMSNIDFYKEFILENEKDVILKIKEYLQVLSNNTTSLKDLHQKLLQLKKEKNKELDEINEKIKHLQ